MNGTALGDLLERPRDDAIAELLGYPQAYEGAARRASPEEREGLVALLEELWPADGFHSLLSDSAEGVPQIARAGWVWLVLGPAVGAPLDPERWAELATSGFVLSDQGRWLSEHYTEEGLERAVELCESDEVRVWAQIVSAIPDEQPVPDILVDAVAERARTYDAERDYFSLSYIGRRLAESGRIDALSELAGVGTDFALVLREPLARAGDYPAAASLLDEALASIDAGKRVDSLDVEWLEGLNEPRLLPALFDCLVATYRRDFEGPLDVSGPLTAAIRRIGGDDAVRRYDQIMESEADPKFKYLRRARDEIVQDELRGSGRRRARLAAESLSLPFLVSEGDDND